MIILRKNTVRGLTTAASVWAVSGIGLAVGVSLYGAALAATALVLLIQGVLRPPGTARLSPDRLYVESAPPACRGKPGGD